MPESTQTYQVGRVKAPYHDLSLYLVTRFASQANRRNVQLLRLKEWLPKVTLAYQTNGSTYFPGRAIESLSTQNYPDITSVLGKVGLHGLAQVIRRRFYFPSANILYVIPAQKKLESAIGHDLRAGRRVCVITLLPPHDLVLIGLNLKAKFPQVFWIIDWQDLWMYDEYYRRQIPKRRRNASLKLERQALDMCDMNVVTNENAEAVMTGYYGVPASRVRPIHHAFDNSDLAAVRERRTSNNRTALQDPIRIGFLGSFFKPPKVPGRKALQAFNDVRRSGIDVILHIFGDKYLDTVSHEPVDGLDWVRVHRRTSHAESLRQIASCDFLLLVLADSPNAWATVHMKLPFYLALGQPVLAMVPDSSAVANIIRKTGTGYVVPTNGPNWGNRLGNVLLHCKQHGILLQRNDKTIERYSWGHVSKHWQALIKSATDAEG